MCHGESPQQQVRDGLLGKGSSQNQKYLKASSSGFSISTLVRPTEILQQRLEQSQQQKTGSCGVPFPASKLTLPSTEQLIMPTYTPMLPSCTAHCFLLGVGALLEVLLPCSVNRTDSIYLSLCLEITPAVTDFSRAYLSPFTGLCEGNSVFFPDKYQIVKRTTCFVWAQNVSPVKATKGIHKYFGTSTQVSGGIPRDFNFIYTLMGRDNLYCTIWKIKP